MSHITHKVAFTGKAGTYFGIWIVNLLLMIVTIGIYSAWAKVRTQRYLYQNTAIDGRTFDYHATGMQILIGRIIVVVGLVAFSLLSAIPALGLVLALGLIFLLPWLLNRSLVFNARVTSFSGLRLNFEGSYWRAFRVYLLYPFLAVFTLYLAFPFVARAIRSHVVGGHRFGTARFAFDSPIGPFYKAFLLAGVWALGVGLLTLGVVLALAALFDPSLFDAAPGAEPTPRQALIELPRVLILVVAVLPAGFIYQAFIRNAVFAAATLEGGHSFASDIAPLRLTSRSSTRSAGSRDRRVRPGGRAIRCRRTGRARSRRCWPGATEPRGCRPGSFPRPGRPETRNPIPARAPRPEDGGPVFAADRISPRAPCSGSRPPFRESPSWSAISGRARRAARGPWS